MPVQGYHPDDDPAAVMSVGYRSHSVSRKKATGGNQLLRGADVSYNGFVFPPTLKAKATVVQEYTKDQRSVKCLLVALTIEAIITPFDVEFLDEIPGSSSPGVTVDPEMDIIRGRLSQPCQHLSFTLQGFGTFIVQGAPAHFTSSANTYGNVVYDVDYGPKPQIIDWEPLGGSLGARIQWLVTTRIPACGRLQGISGLDGILDFTYEIAWRVDDAGFFARTVTGSIELARTRSASAASIHANNIISLGVDKARLDTVVKAVETMFPVLGGFTRSDSYKLADNKKFYTFSFTDTEMPSPTPIPKGVLRMNMSESLSSSLVGAAFKKWNWSFSGDISVYNSKAQGQDIVLNKRLAINALYLVLKDRLDRIKGIVRKKITPAENPNASPEWISVAYALPTRIELANEIFGTGISVNLNFMLLCGPNELLYLTGIFDAVRSANFSWDEWRQHYQDSGTRTVYKNVLPEMDAIVDLCHPLTTYPGSTVTHKRDPSPLDRKTIFLTEVPSEDNSWIDYNNQFGVETSHQSTGAVLLSPGAAPIYPEASKTPDKDKVPKLVPPQPGSQESYGPTTYLAPDIQVTANPITVITMVGSAERIGYPINPPEVESIGGRKVVKYGTDLVIPSQKPSGFTKAGVLANIHMLSWRKSYIVTGYPTAQGEDQWAIKSDGHPQEIV